jgi:hypothetical protein
VPSKEPKKPAQSSIFGTLVLFIILFAVGFWLSGYARKLVSGLPFFPKSEELTPTPTPTITSEIETIAQNQFSGWQTYSVMNGMTRQIHPGISFKLPSDVLSPICDGTACPSQGTYLTGGTRFTVALRGEGQVLPDYRGRVISDLSGKPFTISDISVAGTVAKDFSGTFAGTTVGGYAFTRMHGVMVDIDGTTSLEVNHFTPAGVSADFESDEVIFQKILTTLVSPKPTTTLYPILFASPTIGATSTPTTTPIVGE